jgi:hypothetical protein
MNTQDEKAALARAANQLWYTPFKSNRDDALILREMLRLWDARSAVIEAAKEDYEAECDGVNCHVCAAARALLALEAETKKEPSDAK